MSVSAPNLFPRCHLSTLYPFANIPLDFMLRQKKKKSSALELKISILFTFWKHRLNEMNIASVDGLLNPRASATRHEMFSGRKKSVLYV